MLSACPFAGVYFTSKSELCHCRSFYGTLGSVERLHSERTFALRATVLSTHSWPECSWNTHNAPTPSFDTSACMISCLAGSWNQRTGAFFSKFLVMLALHSCCRSRTKNDACVVPGRMSCSAVPAGHFLCNCDHMALELDLVNRILYLVLAEFDTPSGPLHHLEKDAPTLLLLQLSCHPHKDSWNAAKHAAETLSAHLTCCVDMKR